MQAGRPRGDSDRRLSRLSRWNSRQQLFHGSLEFRTTHVLVTNHPFVIDDINGRETFDASCSLVVEFGNHRGEPSLGTSQFMQRRAFRAHGLSQRLEATSIDREGLHRHRFFRPITKNSDNRTACA